MSYIPSGSFPDRRLAAAKRYIDRFTGEELFDEYAWDLMATMQEQLHANYRPDYERGIAGIGVGIDYLIRSGLIEVDGDFFEDLDERMYRAVMYDPYPDYSRDTARFLRAYAGHPDPVDTLVETDWERLGDVAHRLSTVRDADKIVVLDKGRIVKEGF